MGSKRVALILDCIGIAFGAVIAAFAIEEFLVPCTILDGGVVGIGIMIMVPCTILDGGVVGIGIMINSLAHIPLGILTIVFRESLIIQCCAEVRKIYGRILSKRRRNTDVFQGVWARLCREDFVLMRGREFLEVPFIIFRFWLSVLVSWESCLLSSQRSA